MHVREWERWTKHQTDLQMFPLRIQKVLRRLLEE